MKKKDRFSDSQIKQMLLEGLSSRKIRKFGVSPKRIARIRRGEIGNRPGAQVKFKEEHKTFILSMLLDDPTLRSSDLREKFQSYFGLSISTGKISEILHHHSFFYGHPIKVQNLKYYQIIARYNFAFENLNNSADFFNTIIFTDECRFQTNPDSQMIYRQKGNYGEKFYANYEKFSTSVMAWGAIGINFKPDLIFIEGTMRWNNYLDMLQNHHFFESAQVRFSSCNFFFNKMEQSAMKKKKFLNIFLINVIWFVDGRLIHRT